MTAELADIPFGGFCRYEDSGFDPVLIEQGDRLIEAPIYHMEIWQRVAQRGVEMANFIALRRIAVYRGTLCRQVIRLPAKAFPQNQHFVSSAHRLTRVVPCLDVI